MLGASHVSLRLQSRKLPDQLGEHIRRIQSDLLRGRHAQATQQILQSRRYHTTAFFASLEVQDLHAGRSVTARKTLLTEYDPFVQTDANPANDLI